MKNEYCEEFGLLMFADQGDDDDVEDAPEPVRTAEEEAAELRDIQLSQITYNLQNDGHLDDAVAHHLTIYPEFVMGAAARPELIFYAKSGLTGQTMTEAVQEIVDVLASALPRGATWTIQQDVFGHEVGRICIESSDAERAHDFMMATMVAHFEGA